MAHPQPIPAARPRTRRRAAWALLPALLALPAWAQETIVVTGRGLGGPTVAGFGDAEPQRSPLQALSIGRAQWADQGVAQLGALTRLDASVGDAYNAEGYWAIVSMRGYTLDNRFNYRRDGLPINAETAIALDNKERLELLKGTSGIQAGTSAPGGLVNLVVKRPAGDGRTGRLEWRSPGTLLAAVDLGQALSEHLALRVNVAAERLDPEVRRTRGQRALAALALDWRPTADALWQLEIESSRQRQPSVAGYSLLGDEVPSPDRIDPRRNLNDQPWRQPVVLNGDTASLRWQQRLPGEATVTLHGMAQRLRSDDRTAFPYGLYDPSSYDCGSTCDRFGPDGSFTYWQFVSDNERRLSTAWQASVSAPWRLGPTEHRLEAGLLISRYRARFQDQVFDIAGLGRIDGSLVTPPSAGFLDANVDRTERSTEAFVRDAVQLGRAAQLWWGLRHTRIDRASLRTSVDGDGSLRPTRFARQISTPWVALSHQLNAGTFLYASWGKGLEADVAPNRARYTNAGESLLLTSRQVELGVKVSGERAQFAATLFDIDRGTAADIGACGAALTCTRQIDGSARHRGVELAWSGQSGAWSWQTSALLLAAERRGSVQPGVNGVRPVNVPWGSLRANLEWNVPHVPGLAALLAGSAESDRLVLPGDSQRRIGGWVRWDAALRWRTGTSSAPRTWRVGVDNLTDRRAWKESPYQFGHAYLYPMPPRAWRAALEAGF